MKEGAISADVSCLQLSDGVSKGRQLNQLAMVVGEPILQQIDPQIQAFVKGSRSSRHQHFRAIGTATSRILAQTGVLDTQCTLHWSRLAAFSELFPRPRVRDALFVKDGQFSTCAGELAALIWR